MKTVFLRLLESDDKSTELLELCSNERLADPSRFEMQVDTFRTIPKSPFAYWAESWAFECFRRFPSLESTERHAAAGASTTDNMRFVRAWWEVASIESAVLGETADGGHRWVPLAKGGSHASFYADVYLLVQWALDGRELKASTGAWRAAKGWGDHWRAQLHNADCYGRPGITWPARSQVGFSSRAMGGGGIFGHKGPTVFISKDEPNSLAALLAIMNSKVFAYLVSLQMAFGSYETGVIQRTPVPDASPSEQLELANLANRAWALRRDIDICNETSHAFTLPALLNTEGGTVATRASAWAEQIQSIKTELAEIQAEIDALCFKLYKIDAADGWAIAEGAGVSGHADQEDDSGGADADDDIGEVVELIPAVLAAGLVSWAVGVALGRFDLRLATGERSWVEGPGPFDPLPVCSPGMLTGGGGLPPGRMLAECRIDVSPVLVDDPGHRLDITTQVRSVFDAAFGEDADRWWADVGAALGAKGGEVGGWLSRGFFDYHLKTYSKSRRKAPILWPIGTLSGSYTVWLYAHRVSSDSLFQILNDIVVPKLQVEERELTQLRQDAGTDPTASQRKAIDAQERFVAELHEFRKEVETVAPLWTPDLNDGVVIVLAPLWKLFAYHRAWSSELKKHWAKLAKGDYDWAQLAMRLWPERVVPKCADDRSLAIAHGLEDIFWVKDKASEDKWLPRQPPATPMDQLIAQRHSPATTAALQRMST